MNRSMALLLTVCSTVSLGQAIKSQPRDDTSPKAMTAAELAVLGDPLFRIVLQSKPNEIRFDEVVKLLKGEKGTERYFMVDEKIIDPAIGQTRRAAVGFDGSNMGFILKPNVMLSVFFDSNAVQPGFIEAWGWDDKRSRYNYYKLDDTGGTVSWKFRGSSIDADKLALPQRSGTCMACHINGGPVMKELPFPWNNWNSFRSQAEYLTPGGANHWPIAEGTRLAALAGAEDMETDFILPALSQFNGRRIERVIRRNAAGTPVLFGGKQEVSDGRRALRALFETTEYNAVSSDAFSGLHPFPILSSGAPSGNVEVPATFFLNANLLAGGGLHSIRG